MIQQWFNKLITTELKLKAKTNAFCLKIRVADAFDAPKLSKKRDSLTNENIVLFHCPRE